MQDGVEYLMSRTEIVATTTTAPEVMVNLRRSAAAGQVAPVLTHAGYGERTVGGVMWLEESDGREIKYQRDSVLMLSDREKCWR